MTDDDAKLSGARMRELEGTSDELDRWRIKAAERAEQRDYVQKDMYSRELEIVRKINDSALVEQESEIYRDMADALDILGRALHEQIRKLEIQIAELRGELKGLRATRRPK